MDAPAPRGQQAGRPWLTRACPQAHPSGAGPAHAGGVRADGRSSDSRAPTGRPVDLLAVASQAMRTPSASMTVVVLVHRCGAVPDSHRVPSCPASARRGGGPSATVSLVPPGKPGHVVESPAPERRIRHDPAAQAAQDGHATDTTTTSQHSPRPSHTDNTGQARNRHHGHQRRPPTGRGSRHAGRTGCRRMVRSRAGSVLLASDR